MKPTIAVVIEGGVLQGVFSNVPDLEVRLVDYDNLNEEYPTAKEVEAAAFKELEGLDHCNF